MKEVIVTPETIQNLRVGSIVFATQQGLGILAKDFYDHGVITDVAIMTHKSRPIQQGWYGGATPILTGRNYTRDYVALTKLVESVDIMLFFETPFYWELIDLCRSMGKKTLLMTMYECTPREMPYIPDGFLTPSALDSSYFMQWKYRQVQVPVPDHIRKGWRLREHARVFVHNAGNGSFFDRNGTNEVLAAWQQGYVKSDARLLLRSQHKLPDKSVSRDNRIRVTLGTYPYGQLFRDDGDVFLFPEKFNGLSLPLQEACASGMLVMATDRYPMNTWLRHEPLIKPEGYEETSISPRHMRFSMATISPREIGRMVDSWYDAPIADYSQYGKVWGQANSWDNLKPTYMEAFKWILST